MAKASVSIGGIDNLTQKAKSVNVIDQIDTAMSEAMDKGEDAMKEAIATRGTGKTWSRTWNGRSGSYPGRIDAGDMQSDARGEIIEKTAHSVTGRLGWEDSSPLYYRLQEAGFNHVLTGEFVEGMRALRDSAELARNSLLNDLNDIARRM